MDTLINLQNINISTPRSDIWDGSPKDENDFWVKASWYPPKFPLKAELYYAKMSMADELEGYSLFVELNHKGGNSKLVPGQMVVLEYYTAYASWNPVGLIDYFLSCLSNQYPTEYVMYRAEDFFYLAIQLGNRRMAELLLELVFGRESDWEEMSDQDFNYFWMKYCAFIPQDHWEYQVKLGAITLMEKRTILGFVLDKTNDSDFNDNGSQLFKILTIWADHYKQNREVAPWPWSNNPVPQKADLNVDIKLVTEDDLRNITFYGPTGQIKIGNKKPNGSVVINLSPYYIRINNFDEGNDFMMAANNGEDNDIEEEEDDYVINPHWKFDWRNIVLYFMCSQKMNDEDSVLMHCITMYDKDMYLNMAILANYFHNTKVLNLSVHKYLDSTGYKLLDLTSTEINIITQTIRSPTFAEVWKKCHGQRFEMSIRFNRSRETTDAVFDRIKNTRKRHRFT
jgi:hypothetical protein